MEILTPLSGTACLNLALLYVEVKEAPDDGPVSPMAAFAGQNVLWDVYADPKKSTTKQQHHPRPGHFLLKCTPFEFRLFCLVDLIRRANKYGFIHEIPPAWVNNAALISQQAKTLISTFKARNK